MAKQQKPKTKNANGLGQIWTDPKSGYMFGVVNYTIAGKRKRKALRSKSGTKAEARQHIQTLLAEIELEKAASREDDQDQDPTIGDDEAASFKPTNLTWQKLGDWYRRHYLRPVKFNADRQVIDGCLSYKQGRRQLRAVVQRLGANKLVAVLTSEDLKTYRATRLAEPVVTVKYCRDPITNRIMKDPSGLKLQETIERQREVGGPHRELAQIRIMLNHAFANGWIVRNPWRKKLIKVAEEKKRDKIATKVEQDFLLEQCKPGDDHTKRRHLFLYLTVMFDTACRSAELRRLLVKDCDFRKNEILVYSYKGGLRTERPIGMTPRARVALVEACQGKSASDFVHTYDVKKKHPDGTFTIEHRQLKNAPKRFLEYCQTFGQMVE